MQKQLIKSVSYNQQEIISNILKLHTQDGVIDCDPTYSKGVFYKNIDKPKYRYDLYPQVNGVEEADCRHLPLEDGSLNCIMFDPPFLATSGKSLKDKDSDGNMIVKRFGCYKNEKELHSMYIDSMKEFYRILKDKGILIFKCQDKISGGTQYMSHSFIIEQAQKIGYYVKDMFILLAKSRMVADWQLKAQKNARKFHSYFIVLQKIDKRVSYV